MFKLYHLALAIAEHEGWYPLCDTRNVNGSLTYRQHNPGALRWSPFQIASKGGFAVFNSDLEGFNALIWDLTQKAKGNTSTGLGPNSTLKQLIYVWAPAADGNKPAAYLKFICEKTGLSSETKLRELLQ